MCAKCDFVVLRETGEVHLNPKPLDKRNVDMQCECHMTGFSNVGLNSQKVITTYNYYEELKTASESTIVSYSCFPVSQFSVSLVWPPASRHFRCSV